jgi:hypothetical protein
MPKFFYFVIKFKIEPCGKVKIIFLLETRIISSCMKTRWLIQGYMNHILYEPVVHQTLWDPVIFLYLYLLNFCVYLCYEFEQRINCGFVYLKLYRILLFCIAVCGHAVLFYVIHLIVDFHGDFLKSEIPPNATCYAIFYYISFVY